MEGDLELKALLKSELGLIKDLGDTIELLDYGPWKAYGNQDCVFVFNYNIKYNCWFGHVYQRQNIRGKKGIELGKQALALFFEDCGKWITYVCACIPNENKAAIAYVKLLGFKAQIFEKENTYLVYNKED